MPTTRKLNQEQHERRSIITNMVQPWLASTGVKTTKGKMMSRKNSRKHGYYNQTHKDYRKGKRRKDVRDFEALCQKLNSTTVNNDNPEEIESLLTLLLQKFRQLYRTYEGIDGNQDLLLESAYVSQLMQGTVNYSLFVSYRKYKKNSQEILNQVKGLERTSISF
jgi:hypothetical protein